MNEIVLRKVGWQPAGQDSFARVDFEIDTPSRRYHTYIAGAGIQQQPGIEAGVALAILAAMRTGRDLRVEGALSNTFLQGLGLYIERFVKSFPDFKPIKVIPASVYDAFSPELPSTRCGSFFSGGVDSFFTLIKGAADITDIIYIHGFDVRLDDFSRREAVDSMGAAVAAEFGVRYCSVESNMGKVLQAFGSWPQHAHGLAMIAVARMFAGAIAQIRIPGTFSIGEQKPWGSWLLTDPLFSDERLRIVHDACDARRMDKIRRLAQSPLALRHLRVCWESVDGMYNCCRCEKCLRTMTSLDILGVLDQSTAFALPLEYEQVAAVCLPRNGLRIFPRENLSMLKETGKCMPELEAALNRQLHRPIWFSRLRLKWRKRLVRWSRLVHLQDKRDA